MPKKAWLGMTYVAFVACVYLAIINYNDGNMGYSDMCVLLSIFTACVFGGISIFYEDEEWKL